MASRSLPCGLLELPAKSQNTALRKNPRSGSRDPHMSCLPGVRDHNEISIRYLFAFLFWPARHFHLPNLPVCAAARACSATFAPKRQCRNAVILHATRVGGHAWHRQTAMIAFFIAQ